MVSRTFLVGVEVMVNCAPHRTKSAINTAQHGAQGRPCPFGCTTQEEHDAHQSAEPSAQGEPVAWRPGDPIYDDAYVRGVAVGFAEDDSRRTTLLRIADRIEARASAPSTPPPAVVEAVPLTGLASDMRSPDDKPRFRVGADGAVIDDDDFIFDALIRIEGDFGEGQRRVYAQWIADTLNEADTKLDRGIAPKAAQEKT